MRLSLPYLLRAVPAPDPIHLNPATEVAERSAGVWGQAESVTVVSTDDYYETREGIQTGWVEAGAKAVEMESATLFTVARRRGVRAGALLAVTDLLTVERERMDQEAVD